MAAVRTDAPTKVVSIDRIIVSEVHIDLPCDEQDFLHFEELSKLIKKFKSNQPVPLGHHSRYIWKPFDNPTLEYEPDPGCKLKRYGTAPNVLRHYNPRDPFENLVAKVAALRKARELENEMETVCPSGPAWFVIWGDNNFADFFTPRAIGIPYYVKRGNPWKVARQTAIVLLKNDWEWLEHFGTMPGFRERKAVLGTAIREAKVDNSLLIDTIVDLAGFKKRTPSGDSATLRGMIAVAKIGVKSWLIDTGASAHLIGCSYLRPSDKHIRKAEESITLATVKGSETLDEVIDISFDILKPKLTAYVAKDDCPPTLSAGFLCEAEGWDFWWPVFSHTIVFTSPNGEKVVVPSVNFTPELNLDQPKPNINYYNDEKSKMGMPASSSGKSSSSSTGATTGSSELSESVDDAVPSGKAESSDKDKPATDPVGYDSDEGYPHGRWK